VVQLVAQLEDLSPGLIHIPFDDIDLGIDVIDSGIRGRAETALQQRQLTPGFLAFCSCGSGPRDRLTSSISFWIAARFLFQVGACPGAGAGRFVPVRARQKDDEETDLWAKSFLGIYL